MAAVTVGAVAKKVVEVLASGEKGRKFLGYTIGIVLVIVLLPLIALTGLFGFLSSEDFSMDAGQIIAGLPAEDRAAIAQIDTIRNFDIIMKNSENALMSRNLKKSVVDKYISYMTGR